MYTNHTNAGPSAPCPCLTPPPAVLSAVRTSQVAYTAAHFNQLPSPATSNQVLVIILAALKRIKQAGLNAIFTPGHEQRATSTQEGDAYGGKASFGGLSSLINRTRDKNPWVLAAPELKFIYSEMKRHNVSVDLTFLHDDYMHVTNEVMEGALWLSENMPSAPGMTNGGLQDPVGLYTSRMFVLSAEQYYVGGPCTFNESVLCANNSAWFSQPFSKPQVMLRTLFQSLIESATLAKRFRLRAWPLLNVGGVPSDSLYRAQVRHRRSLRCCCCFCQGLTPLLAVRQVYGALALGQHGIDYFYWGFNHYGLWDTGCTPQLNCLPLCTPPCAGGCTKCNNATDCWPKTNKACYPKGAPGLLYDYLKTVNADAMKWGSLLVAATHVGSLSTMPSTCNNDTQCTAFCAGGYPRNTTAVCFEGACQCILLPDASPVVGPRQPAPGLAVEHMVSDVLVGLFTSGDSGGYLMVVDTRAALSIGAPGTAKRSVSLQLSSKCTATAVPPGVERSLASLQFSALHQEAADGAHTQAVTLSLQAGEGALLKVIGVGCAGVLRGAGRWLYDERSIAARQLFGRNILVNAKTHWNPWHNFQDTKDWTPWQTAVESSTSRRADTRNGAGPKDRDSLIIAGSYHEQAGGITDVNAARRFAEGGFTAVSINSTNASAVAAALTWAAAYGISVFTDAAPMSHDSIDSWGCHTSFGGEWLSATDTDLHATVTRLRQRGPWLLPIVYGVTSAGAAAGLAAQGAPLAAVTVALASQVATGATAVKTLRLLGAVRTAIALNASSKASVAVAIPVCATNSDSLLRFAAYASLPLAFTPRTAGQRLTGALIWEGLGQCATIGTAKFDLIANINNRLTQQAWISAFANTSASSMRIWSTASFAVEGSVAPGSIAGGLVEIMDDELLVFEFDVNRTGNVNGTIYVVSAQLDIKPGGAPRRTVRIQLRGATCQYRNTTKAAPHQFCKDCPGWQGEVPMSCSGGVASTQPVEGSCFQNEPTAASCGLHRVGNVLPLLLPGGSAQLVTYIGDACHDVSDPARSCPK